MALASMVGHFVVLRSLRKRGVFMPAWARSMPWYVHQACEFPEEHGETSTAPLTPQGGSWILLECLTR